MSKSDYPAATQRMLRVDQAGEYGAVRIYAGQMAVMGARGPHAQTIIAMAEQEVRHRRDFDAILARRGGRPTLLQPLWHVAGFALGAATAPPLLTSSILAGPNGSGMS